MTWRSKLWRVEVTWDDSTVFEGGWRSIKAALARRRRVRCHSVGFILADDAKGIVLAGSLHESEAVGIVVIPRGQIVSIRRLR